MLQLKDIASKQTDLFSQMKMPYMTNQHDQHSDTERKRDRYPEYIIYQFRCPSISFIYTYDLFAYRFLGMVPETLFFFFIHTCVFCLFLSRIFSLSLARELFLFFFDCFSRTDIKKKIYEACGHANIDNLQIPIVYSSFTRVSRVKFIHRIVQVR